MIIGIIAKSKKSNYLLLAFVATFLATALITGNTVGSLAQPQQRFPESIIAASSTETTPHAFKLKATQQGEDGEPKRISGFKIDLTNVVTAQINSQVLVLSDGSVQVIGVMIRSVSGQIINLVPSSTTKTNAFSYIKKCNDRKIAPETLDI